MDNDILIQFEDAVVTSGETPVIYGLDMQVKRGDFVYIIGKVGSGKTSIIRTVIGENALASGKASVCGMDLRKLKTSGIPALRRSIGVVFQDFQLLMDRNIHDNLEFVLKCTGWKDKNRIAERIDQVLKDVGMKTKSHKMPFQLSGGEQQRIAIARSLLNSPQLILADEPTGNLDAETADEIMQLLRSINEKTGTAVVMVTHNVTLVEKYPGRVFECKDEKCVEQCS